MWECGCGCQGIAADLAVCPMCEKERDMPKATSGGASNANAGPGEPGHVPPPETPVPAGTETAAASPAVDQAPADPAVRPPAAAPKAAWVDHVVASGLDRAEAEAMTKEALRAWTPQAPEPAAAPDGPVSEPAVTADAEPPRSGPEAAP